MSIENGQASDPTARRADSAAAPQSGFVRLARRISAWTTNGLLTVIILVAGLGFGRQVLHWWAADTRAKTASGTPSAGDGLGDPSQPHVLQFGDQPWSLRPAIDLGRSRRGHRGLARRLPPRAPVGPIHTGRRSQRSCPCRQGGRRRLPRRLGIAQGGGRRAGKMATVRLAQQLPDGRRRAGGAPSPCHWTKGTGRAGGTGPERGQSHFRRTKIGTVPGSWKIGTVPRSFGPGPSRGSTCRNHPRRGNLGIGGPACTESVDIIYVSAGFGHRPPRFLSCEYTYPTWWT